jgi:hypothetical protein
VRFDKSFLRDEAQKLVPRVEELSGLKCNIEGVTFRLTRGIIHPIFSSHLSLRNALILYYHHGGSYSHELKRLSISSKMIENEVYSSTLAHELMHNAQFSSFPEILYLSYSYDFGKGGTNPYPYLIEGDAELISSYFPYYGEIVKIPDLSMTFIGKDHYKKFYSKKKETYEVGKKVLLEKFGGDREEINHLYRTDGERLIDIFGLEKEYSKFYMTVSRR